MFILLLLNFMDDFQPSGADFFILVRHSAVMALGHHHRLNYTPHVVCPHWLHLCLANNVLRMGFSWWLVICHPGVAMLCRRQRRRVGILNKRYGRITNELQLKELVVVRQRVGPGLLVSGSKIRSSRRRMRNYSSRRRNTNIGSKSVGRWSRFAS